MGTSYQIGSTWRRLYPKPYSIHSGRSQLLLSDSLDTISMQYHQLVGLKPVLCFRDKISAALCQRHKIVLSAQVEEQHGSRLGQKLLSHYFSAVGSFNDSCRTSVPSKLFCILLSYPHRLDHVEARVLQLHCSGGTLCTLVRMKRLHHMCLSNGLHNLRGNAQVTPATIAALTIGLNYVRPICKYAKELTWRCMHTDTLADPVYLGIF